MGGVKQVSFVLLPNPQLSTPTMHINLGLLYVATEVKKRGHIVKVVDLRSKKSIEQSDCSSILPADFVCFSATSGEIKFAKILNTRLHSVSNNVVTVLGGAHPSLCPTDCSGFDVVVVGEGEDVIIDIVEKGLLGEICQKRFTKNIDRFCIDWDLLPSEQMFSHTLLPGEKYGSSEDRGITLIGSRGCPYKCKFCANIHSTPVVFRSPENIYKEAATLREKYGVTEFRFVDDMFTLRPSWTTQVCAHLGTLDIKYRCHTRADFMTKDIAKKLYNSGCVEVAIGVESGDQAVLNVIDKKETVETFIEAIGIIQDVGMGAKVYLISGLPGETEGSLERTYRFMQRAKPDKWTLSQFTPYPGCAIQKNPEAFGVNIINKDYANYWNFPDRVTYELINKFTAEELRERYKILYELLRSGVWSH